MPVAALPTPPPLSTPQQRYPPNHRDKMPVAALPTPPPLSRFPPSNSKSIYLSPLSSSIPHRHGSLPLRRASLQLSSTAIPFGPSHLKRNTLLLPLHATDLDSGLWGEESRQLLRRVLDSVADLCDLLPQPVKSFPWSRVASNLAGIVFRLVFVVAKYLCVPVLAVTSLSEMSYCAHERKMKLVPIPFLIGVAAAGVMKETAVDLSPELQEGGVPWHLVAMGVFFVLLKLPGPYFPYLARFVVPHFANGGLWSTLWFAFRWNETGSGKWREEGHKSNQIGTLDGLLNFGA